MYNVIYMFPNSRFVVEPAMIDVALAALGSDLKEKLGDDAGEIIRSVIDRVRKLMGEKEYQGSNIIWNFPRDTSVNIGFITHQGRTRIVNCGTITLDQSARWDRLNNKETPDDRE